MNQVVSDEGLEQLRATIIYALDHEMYKTAEFTCERLVALNPNNLDSIHLYGLTMFKCQRYKTSYNLTSRHSKQHVGCAYVFAQSCLKLNKENIGISVLEYTMGLWSGIGDVSNELGGKGLYNYDPMARYQPDSVACYLLLAKLYKSIDDVKKSSLNYANVLKINPLIFEAFEELCKMGVKVKVSSIYNTNPIDQIGNGLFKTSLSGNGNHTAGAFNDGGDPLDNNINNNNSNFNKESVQQTPESNSIKNFLVTPRVKQTHITDAPLRRTGNKTPLTFDGFKQPALPSVSHETVPEQRKMGIRNSTSITSRLLNYPINSLTGSNSHSNDSSNSDSLLVTPLKKDGTNKRGIGSAFPGSGSNLDMGLSNKSNTTLITTITKNASKLLTDPYLLMIYSKLAKSYKSLCMYDCFKSIRILDSLPDNEKNTPWVLGKLGKLHYEIVNYEKSENYFKKLRELDRTRLEDMEIYSTLLWHLHKEIELSFLSHELLEIDEFNSPETWITIGNMFSLNREPDEAIKCFSKACEINKKFVYGYTLQGHEYLSNDAFENAMECFRMAILIDNRHYNAYYGIGMCYLKLGDFQKSEYHFRKANNINPVNVILICCIGMILEKLGKREEALKNYEFATKLQPLSTLALFKKAQSLFSLKEYELSLKEFEKLKNLAPDEASIHYLLGKLYKFKGQKLDAVRHFTIALNLDPKGSHLIKEALKSLEDDI